jgi:hypothetical protein
VTIHVGVVDGESVHFGSGRQLAVGGQGIRRRLTIWQEGGSVFRRQISFPSFCEVAMIVKPLYRFSLV